MLMTNGDFVFGRGEQFFLQIPIILNSCKVLVPDSSNIYSVFFRPFRLKILFIIS
jgi:hypothetical protein